MNNKNLYVLTNGTSYLVKGRNGKFTETNNVTLADRMYYEDAMRVYKSGLSKVQKRLYKVVPIDERANKVEENSLKKHEQTIFSEDGFSFNGLYCNLDDAETLLRQAQEVIAKQEKYIADILRQKEERVSELKEFVITEEQKIMDLLHLLELESLNAVEMMQVAKKLKEVRIQRRKYKDEIKMLQGITKDSIKLGTYKNVVTFLENRTYQPRVLIGFRDEIRCNTKRVI